MENKNITAQDVKILVAYHKPSVLVKNEILTPIHLGRALGNQISKDGATSNEDYQWMLDNMIGDDTGDNISSKNRRYNELTAIYWAWKNQDKLGNPKYIGFMHYRRQLNFSKNNLQDCNLNSNDIVNNILTKEKTNNMFNPQDIINTLKSCDFVTLAPTVSKFSIYNNYSDNNSIKAGHVEQDLHLMLDVVKQLYPNFVEIANTYIQGNLNYLANIIIMPVKEFNNYCKWLFNILFAIEPKIDYTNRNILQQRALGFLAERLTGIYITYLKQHYKIEHKKIYQSLFDLSVLTKAKNKQKKLLKYKILSKITFGKLRKKYKTKYTENSLFVSSLINSIGKK